MIIRVVDLETTGFEPPEHTVCEVGWADLVEANDHANDWQIGTIGNILCNPGRAIPPEVSAIHHIIDEDCAGLRSWRQVLQEVCCGTGIFSIDAFCAHNAKFERQWIDGVAGKLPWICTYKCALRLWPDAQSHSNQALRYWIRLEGLDRRWRASAIHVL